MNTTPKPTVLRTEKIDSRYGNVEAVPKAKGKLSKPSRSEGRWLKAAVPVIGAPHDDREEKEENPA